MANFDLQKALNGASLLLGDKSIIQFKKSGIQKASQEYTGIDSITNTAYYFNSQGKSTTEETLKISDYKIKKTSGTEATRGEGGETEDIKIDNMQPRELFAHAAMQSILTKLDIPILSINDYTIKLIAELSYKIAQEMYNQGATNRAEQKKEEEEEKEPKPADVDINNVTSTTDKILYNMAQDIKKLQKSLEYEETIEGEEGTEPTTEKKSVLVKLQENIQGLEEALKKQNEETYIRKIDINKVTAEKLPIEIKNQELKTIISNENVPVLIKNESIKVTPTAAVEVTGEVTMSNPVHTVSVDNFPSSVSIDNTVEVTGNVEVSGTVSVDNFPTDNPEEDPGIEPANT
jgi:hypothetical protein